jgi:hypothetical protein
VSHNELKLPTDITVPPTSMWARLPLIGGVIGVVGVGATLAAAIASHDHRAWFSYLFGYELFLAIALGALGFVLIQHAVRAGWSTVVRRIAETMMMTLPVLFILWIPIRFLGYHELFPWTDPAHVDEVIQRKQWYLSDGFFTLRGFFYGVVWIALAWILYSRSVKLDGVTDRNERDRIVRSLWGVSAGGLFLYALTLSFQAFDWLMSLLPHWYSTMFGVYYFATAMLAFYSLLALISLGMQNGGMLKTAINPEHYHDIGKFVFGHTVFWAYIAFSQFMLQWYANIPEETEFFMMRVEGGWEYISYALPVIHFFIPFLYLVSRHVKRHRLGLAIGATWQLTVTVIHMFWLVIPNAGGHGGGHGEHAGPHLDVAWTDIASLIGFAGVFFAVFAFFLKKNKVVAIGDPRLPESLVHENY